MTVKINLGEWNNIFAVPTVLVDKYIKLAGGSQIKVLLCILRYAGKNVDSEYISKILAMHPADVKDALQYWTEVGLISNIHEEIVPNGISKNKETIKKKEEERNESATKNRELVRRVKPDSEYISKRLREDRQMAFLMQEAQVILGRPISQNDLAILIMAHDNDGLPVDVIIMLLQYAVSIGKGNMKYIEKVAIAWGAEEIDSIKKAESKIKSLSNVTKAWFKVEKIMGTERRSPTAKESEQVNRWINEYHMNDELITEAYERCVNVKGKPIINYMDFIIKRWYNSGIRSLSQARAEIQQNKDKKKGSNRSAYNIEEYDNLSAFD